MKKRILSFVLALVLCVSLLPVALAAEEPVETAGWTVREIAPLGTYYCYYGNEWYPQFSDGFAMVRKNGYGNGIGFIDTTGKEVVFCRYYEAKEFSEGFAWVRNSYRSSWFFIDKTGRQVGPCQYDYSDVRPFVNGMAAVQRDGMWGFVDTTGAEVIPCQYDKVEEFSEGLAAVMPYGENSLTWGYIDKMGKNVIHFQYDDAHNFSEGLAAVCKNDKWGFVDAAGVEIIPCQYVEVLDFSESLVAVRSYVYIDEAQWQWGQWGYIDKTGTEVVPCQYDGVKNFSDGIAMVWEDNGYSFLTYVSFIDKAGQVVGSPLPGPYLNNGYDLSARDFSEHLAAVRRDGWWGFIDTTGEEVISCKYGRVEDFSNGLAAVKLDGKWGFVDTTGNESIPCQFDVVESFVGEFACVGNGSNTKYGVIDRTGAIVIPYQYDAIKVFPNGLIAAKQDDEFALFSIAREGDVEPTPVEDELTLSKNTVSVKAGSSDTVTATVSGYEGMNLYAVSSDTSKVTVVVKDQTVTVTGVTSGDALVYIVMAFEQPALAQAANDPNAESIHITVTSSSSKPSGGGGGGGSGGGGSSGGSSGGGGRPTVSLPVTVTVDAPNKPVSETFTDVVKDSWYENGVTFVVDNGLFNGVGDGTFAPNSNMTRAMLMTVLARLDGQDTGGGETWYAKAMDWAKASGVSDGTAPDSSVTREQLVTMLCRYAKPTAIAGDLTAFADSDRVSAWAIDAMTWAVSQNIVTGKSNSLLDPQGSATRAEVATILQRFCEHS